MGKAKKIGKSLTKGLAAFGAGGLLGGELASAGVAGLGAKAAADALVPDLQLPQATPEVVMPTANDEAARAARRRRMQAAQMRSGRQSTMLSTTDTLG